MYHYIRVNPDPADRMGYNLSVTPETFAAQVEYLTRQGYRAISIGQLVAHLRENQPLPPKPIILTFDDGYRDFYTNAYPVLKRYGQKGTVFVITGLIGNKEYLTWEQIMELATDGIDFGAHTVHHPDLQRTGEGQAAIEIKASKEALELALGKSIIAFGYPSGRYNDSVVNLVKAAGFQAAVTTQQGIWHRERDLFILNRLRVTNAMAPEALVRYIESQ